LALLVQVGAIPGCPGACPSDFIVLLATALFISR
jgi:hypothetical protein